MTFWEKLIAFLSGGALVVAVGVGVWVGAIQTQVEINGRWIERNQEVVERLAVVENEVKGVRLILQRIEDRLFGPRE